MTAFRKSVCFAWVFSTVLIAQSLSSVAVAQEGGRHLLQGGNGGAGGAGGAGGSSDGGTPGSGGASGAGGAGGAPGGTPGLPGVVGEPGTPPPGVPGIVVPKPPPTPPTAPAKAAPAPAKPSPGCPDGQFVDAGKCQKCSDVGPLVMVNGYQCRNPQASGSDTTCKIGKLAGVLIPSKTDVSKPVLCITASSASVLLSKQTMGSLMGWTIKGYTIPSITLDGVPAKQSSNVTVAGEQKLRLDFDDAKGALEKNAGKSVVLTGVYSQTGKANLCFSAAIAVCA